ncbi:MAG: Hpt domain-containing protein [Caldilinea sp. CFX5]|nr:Hpt domain-containing protein [Caldilinea sp. CFX5]
MTNAPVIDRETIAILQEMDAITTDDNLLLELIDDFLLHSADLVKVIQHSLRMDTLQLDTTAELAAQSHSLKGASLNIGALALFQVCDTIETLARQQRITKVDYWAAELNHAYQETALALAELRSRASRGETIDDLLG